MAQAPSLPFSVQEEPEVVDSAHRTKSAALDRACPGAPPGLIALTRSLLGTECLRAGRVEEGEAHLTGAMAQAEVPPDTRWQRLAVIGADADAA